MRVQFQEEKMHTKDAIKFALTVSNGAVMSVINEMSGAATTFPTLNGGGPPPAGVGHPTPGGGSVPAGPFGDTNTTTRGQPDLRGGWEPGAAPSQQSPIPRRRDRNPATGGD